MNRSSYFKAKLIALYASALVLFSTTCTFAWKEDIGYNQLLEEFGNNLPNGSNLSLQMVETTRNGNYAADPSKSYFSGKSLTYFREPSTFSDHANQVGRRFFGTESIIPESPGANVMLAGWWEILDLSSSTSPQPVDNQYDIVNHSWISHLHSSANIQTIKTDFVVDKFDTLVVAGVDNTSSFPMLLGNCYNALIVGSSTGNHSIGGSNLEVSGRMKPDIVGTKTFTSYATPIVSSAAGLLLSKIKDTPPLHTAEQTEVLKAILLAGATKQEFTNWSHSSTKPLDSRFGAGELNIYNSYNILLDGPTTNESTSNSPHGWSFENIQTNGSKGYWIDATQTENFTISAILTWHRKIIPANDYWTEFNNVLENLDLKLWHSNFNGEKLSLIWESISQIDNVEHVYQTGLAPNYYLLEVVNNTNAVDYALAWRTNIESSGEGPNPNNETIAVSITGLSNGQGLTVNDPQNITITQSGTTSTVQKVELLADSSLISSDTTSPYEFTWTPNSIGTTQLTGRVTTELGSYYSNITVSVVDDALSPSLDSPAHNASFNVNETLSLRASISNDKGTVDHVDFYANNSLLGTDSTAPYSLNWTPIAIGNHTLEVVATNASSIEYTSSESTITIIPDPVKISLNLSSSSIETGASVTLTPSYSDEHGTLQKIEYFNGGTLIATRSSSPFSYTWTPSQAGNYSLSAQTTDSYSGTATSNPQSLTVADATPESELIEIAINGFAGGTYTIGDTDAFQVSVSNAQSTISNIKFYDNNILIHQENSDPFDFTFAPSTNGSHALKLITTTELGTYTTHFSASAEYAPLNTSLTSPSNALKIDSDTSVHIAASVDNTNNAVASVAFLINGATLFTDTEAPYEVTWTPSLANTYTLQAKATNASGIQSLSEITVITVNDPRAEAIPFSLSLSASEIETGDSTLLSVQFEDSQNQFQELSFFQGETLLTTLTQVPFTYNFQASSAGNFSFKATLTNSSGITTESAIATLSVTDPVAESHVISTTFSGLSKGTYKKGQNDRFKAIVSNAQSEILDVSFYDNNELVKKDTIPNYSFTFYPEILGLHDLKLVTTTELGAYETTTQVTVIDGDLSASITSPPSGSSFVENETIDITPLIEASNAEVSKVQLLVNGSIQHTSVTAPYHFTWTPNAPGTYTLRLKATNASEISFLSESVSVSITDYIAPLVPITLEASATSIELGNTLSLATSTNDPENVLDRVVFTANGNPIGTTTSASPSLTWTPDTAGAYTLAATSYNADNKASLSNKLTLTVKEPIEESEVISLEIEGLNHSDYTKGDSDSLSVSVSGALSAIESVQLLANGEAISTDLTTPFEFDWIASQLGETIFEAIVKTERGTYKSYASAKVTDGDLEVRLDHPSDTLELTTGETLAISGSASGSNASLDSLSLLINDVKIASSSSSPFVFDWTPETPGDYTLQLKATNGSAIAYLSPIKLVTVEAYIPLAVSAVLSAEKSNLTLGETTNVSIEVDDPDEALQSIEIFVGDSKVTSLAAEPWEFNYTPTVPGEQTLQAKTINTSGIERLSNEIVLTVSEPIIEGDVIDISLQGFSSETYRKGQNEAITITVANNVSTIESVQLFDGIRLIGTDTQAPFTFDWIASELGARSIKAIVSTGENEYQTFTSVSVLDGTLSASLTRPSSEIETEEDTLFQATASITGENATISKAYLLIDGSTHSSATNAPFSWDWMPNAPGAFELKVKAINASGEEFYSLPQTVVVTKHIQPAISVALSSNETEIEQGEGIILSASFEDPNNTLERIDFYEGSTLIGSRTSQPYSLNWSPTRLGLHTLKAISTNADGLQSESTTVSITVTEAINESDVIAISLQTGSDTISIGQSINALTTVAGNISPIESVSFYSNSRLLAKLTQAPYQFQWSPESAGSHTLVAKVKTQNGAYEVLKTILVTNDGDLSVGLSGIANGSKLEQNQTRLLTCLVDSENANVSKVTFYLNGQAVREDMTAPYEFSWTASELGTHEIYAAATNLSGQSFRSPKLSASVEEEESDNSGESNGEPNGIRFLNPSDGQTMPFDEIVNLAVEIDRPDEIQNVSYFLNNLPIAESEIAPFVAKTIFLIKGELTLSAIATDASGEEIFTQPITIIVESSESKDPNTEAQEQSFFARDIGDPGKTGSTQYLENTGEFQVSSAGQDIWGAADSFRFVYLPFQGDGSLSLRLRDLNALSNWTKGGLMIRSGLEPESENAALLLNGNGNLSFQYRELYGSDTRQASLSSSSSDPIYLKIERQGMLISAHSSYDGNDWNLVFQRKLALTEVAYIGMALSSGSKNRLSAATFDRVETTGNVLNYIPDNTAQDPIDLENLFATKELYARDIGNVSEAGSVQYIAEKDQYILKATTDDIWGDNDQLRFAYIQVSGNLEITARVNSIQRASNWTKAGVMIRESLDSDSKQASTLLTAKGSAAFLRRLNTSESTYYSGVHDVKEPAFLRLRRSGETFTSQYSLDGTSWITIGEEQLDLPNSIYLGIALASANPNKSANAAFDQVSVKQLD